MKNNIIEKAQKASIKAEIIETLVLSLQNMINDAESSKEYYTSDSDYDNRELARIKLRIAVLEEIAESLIK